VTRFLVLSLSCFLCACSEAPGPSRPWQPYGTNERTGQLEWFYVDYLTRSDCLVGVKHLVEESIHSQWYKKPYGCMYWGHQNPYVQYLINWYFAKDDFRCIARYITREAAESGAFYKPVLKGTPDQSGIWYCYL
jgi:hypothetical protein